MAAVRSWRCRCLARGAGASEGDRPAGGGECCRQSVPWEGRAVPRTPQDSSRVARSPQLNALVIHLPLSVGMSRVPDEPGAPTHRPPTVCAGPPLEEGKRRRSEQTEDRDIPGATAVAMALDTTSDHVPRSDPRNGTDGSGATSVAAARPPPRGVILHVVQADSGVHLMVVTATPEKDTFRQRTELRGRNNNEGYIRSIKEAGVIGATPRWEYRLYHSTGAVTTHTLPLHAYELLPTVSTAGQADRRLWRSREFRRALRQELEAAERTGVTEALVRGKVREVRARLDRTRKRAEAVRLLLQEETDPLRRRVLEETLEDIDQEDADTFDAETEWMKLGDKPRPGGWFW